MGNEIFQSIISLGLDQHCPIERYAIILNIYQKLNLKNLFVVTLATLQVLSSHLWLVAAILDSAGLD